MPTYDYIREDGTRFEFLQKMSDAPLKNCPETGQKVTRAISGGTGVIYKGTGFYNTDYKNKGNGTAQPKNTENQPASAETESGSAEKKSTSEN